MKELFLLAAIAGLIWGQLQPEEIEHINNRDRRQLEEVLRSI